MKTNKSNSMNSETGNNMESRQNQNTGMSRTKVASRSEDDTTTSRATSGGSLEDLKAEWSYEKVVEVAAAVLTIASIFLNKTQKRKLDEFGESVSSILGVESLRDWTPPAGVLKKIGLRSQGDIDKEISRLSA